MKLGIYILSVTLNSILTFPFPIYLLLPQSLESDISA